MIDETRHLKCLVFLLFCTNKRYNICEIFRYSQGTTIVIVYDHKEQVTTTRKEKIMIKNIPVNKKLSLNGCWKMVHKVNSLEKAQIAMNWLRENTVITNEEYNDLMMELSYIVRTLHRESRSR